MIVLLDYATFLENRRLFNFRMPDTRRVWRWEMPVYDCCAKCPWANSLVGTLFPNNHWPTFAQDREVWQALEEAFVRSHAVNPRSAQAALEDWYGGALLGIPGFNQLEDDAEDMELRVHQEGD